MSVLDTAKFERYHGTIKQDIAIMDLESELVFGVTLDHSEA